MPALAPLGHLLLALLLWPIGYGLLWRLDRGLVPAESRRGRLLIWAGLIVVGLGAAFTVEVKLRPETSAQLGNIVLTRANEPNAQRFAPDTYPGARVTCPGPNPSVDIDEASQRVSWIINGKTVLDKAEPRPGVTQRGNFEYGYSGLPDSYTAQAGDKTVQCTRTGRFAKQTANTWSGCDEQCEKLLGKPFRVETIAAQVKAIPAHRRRVDEAQAAASQVRRALQYLVIPAGAVLLLTFLGRLNDPAVRAAIREAQQRQAGSAPAGGAAPKAPKSTQPKLQRCPQCHGSGKVENPSQDIWDKYSPSHLRCPLCNGSGKVYR